MIRTQKILIANNILTEQEISILMQQNDCVAYYRNIPPSLQTKATIENWILPYIYTVIWDDSVL
jgi:hypothetical protein